MSETRKDGGPAACAWCDRAAYIRQGRIMLCLVHYRISSMRSRATRDGKFVPTRQAIEALIPTPFDCIGCRRAMDWSRAAGASSQATLQHDRSGAMRIICLACNTRHAQHPGDTFYDVPDGHKRCAKCDRTLPHGSFSRDKSRPLGLRSSCRDCNHTAHTKWRLENRAYYNAKQRENRARRAASD